MKPSRRPGPFIHPGADVSDEAEIGEGTKVWNGAQLSSGVIVGSQCVIATRVTLGTGTVIGDRVKLQTGCGVFGARIEDGVMLAPNVQLIEDPAPRAVTPDGAPKTGTDWEHRPVVVKSGASVGANSVLLPGVTVGEHAMVGAGSVVGRDVPAHALVLGNPARQIGWVCYCGKTLDVDLICPTCKHRFTLAADERTIVEITNATHKPQ